VCAYGVSTQALMYHNQRPGLELFKNVFFPGYFVIGGDYYEREKIMSKCSGYETDKIGGSFDAESDCPEPIGAGLSLGILVVYIIMQNILVVNLLIAIFSNTYAAIESDSDMIWKFQRCSLICEYSQKPALPTPLTAVYFLVQCLRLDFIFMPVNWLLKIHRRADVKCVLRSADKIAGNDVYLKRWENFIIGEYFAKKQFDFKVREYKAYY